MTCRRRGAACGPSWHASCFRMGSEDGSQARQNGRGGPRAASHVVTYRLREGDEAEGGGCDGGAHRAKLKGGED